MTAGKMEASWTWTREQLRLESNNQILFAHVIQLSLSVISDIYLCIKACTVSDWDSHENWSDPRPNQYE